jgi:uncharacterized protein (DUF362 family)
MNPNHPMSRRESIKKLFQVSGTIALAGLVGDPLQIPAWAGEAEKKQKGFLVKGVGHTPDYDVKALTRSVFDAAGGIKRFISQGDVVVVKPNISWARPPHLAATTNPEVLQGVIELCQEAGAKRVKIADHTIHDYKRCFALSGAGMVAKKTGAELIVPRSSLMRQMKIQGSRLDTWPVFTPVVEADKLINLPVAKHHSLSGLTLGMKNWIGAVGGGRWSLHQDINQTIVDLAQFFRPTITLIDAIRILTRNGPSGGSEGDVALENTLILSNDPVAADATAALLFGMKPSDLGCVKLGEKWGLGTTDFETLTQSRVTI